MEEEDPPKGRRGERGRGGERRKSPWPEGNLEEEEEEEEGSPFFLKVSLFLDTLLRSVKPRQKGGRRTAREHLCITFSFCLEKSPGVCKDEGRGGFKKYPGENRSRRNFSTLSPVPDFFFQLSRLSFICLSPFLDHASDSAGGVGKGGEGIKGSFLLLLSKNGGDVYQPDFETLKPQSLSIFFVKMIVVMGLNDAHLACGKLMLNLPKFGS